MATVTEGSMLRRMKGAAMLDVAVYEEVEADTTATSQAAGVVALVAVAQAIGASGDGLGGALGAVLAAVVGWLLWAGNTYGIGDKLLGGPATWGELLRTIGFAQSPGLLYLLAWIPVLGSLVRIVVAFWVLIAGIIAIRQALDFGTGKAVITAAIGWLAFAIPALIIGFIVR